MLFAAPGGLTTQAASSFKDGDVFSVNGKTITIKAAALPVVGALTSGQSLAGNVVTDGTGNSTVYLGDPSAATSVATVGDLTTAIDLASGVSTSRRSTALRPVLRPWPVLPARSLPASSTLSSSTGADLSITGKADSLKALGPHGCRWCRSYDAHRGSATSASQPRQSGGGWFDAERQRQDHHVQERERCVPAAATFPPARASATPIC